MGFFNRNLVLTEKLKTENAKVVSNSQDTTLRQRKDGLTMKEVAKHNTKEDCWLVIRGKAYDVTNFIPKHPGGDIILSYAGLDATDVFDAFHDSNSDKYLKTYELGNVTDYAPSQESVEQQRIKEALEKENLFESNKLYYAYKCATNLSIVTLSALIASSKMFGDSILRVVIAGVIMGFFWQQCGWLSHDFLHHQVFKNRKWNNFMGYILGNISQGFSVSWWKAKHNLHHAVPNIAGYDPDIDTLPFLAWSEKLIDHELEGLPDLLVKYQYIFYFPLLSAARLSWMLQSFFYAKDKSHPSVRTAELITLGIHYTWYLALILLTMTWKEAIVFVIVSQASTGLLLASAFALGHNGMPIYDNGSQADQSFMRLQVTTGRDVHDNLFAHWFMGGLDMQIEHHVFPRVPRHNLRKVQEKLVPVCDKYNIKHHTTGFWSGSVEVLARLYSVSSIFKKL